MGGKCNFDSSIDLNFLTDSLYESAIDCSGSSLVTDNIIFDT